MSSIREEYDLPERTPVPVRHWALMLLVPAVALVLWLVLPSSPVVVALLVLVVLASVFAGVRGVLGSRQLHQPPRRNPVTPPSARG